MTAADVGLVRGGTDDLDPTLLDAARAMVTAAFDGDFADTDWEHCLGGEHIVLVEGPAGEPVGHVSVVLRRLHHQGRVLRAGYVEGMAVRPDRRRRGYAAMLMAAAEATVRSGFELGALSASEMAVPLYAGRGWLRWRGPTSVLTPDGARATPDDDDSVYVLPVSAALDLDSPLACEWRDGDVW